MENKELAEKMGLGGGEKVAAYKLNEVKMSGDTGIFTLREILSEKGEDGKYPTVEIGKAFAGVILKKRWRLFRYEEKPDGKGGQFVTTYMTSEYDLKNKDAVVLFNNGEKGVAAEIKAKYNLGTQCVLYVYLPGRKETVRVVVKSSALGSERNPEDALGLFDYLDSFNIDAGEFPCDYQTQFSGVYREDEKNKRKSYWAMTFKRGAEVSEENRAKVRDMIEEVHKKVGVSFADSYTAPTASEDHIEYPTEDINPDDIPF